MYKVFPHFWQGNYVGECFADVAMFSFIMNWDIVLSSGSLLTTFASCVWSEFLLFVFGAMLSVT